MLPRVDCSVANVGYRNHRQRRECVIVHQVLTVQTEPAGPGLIRIRRTDIKWAQWGSSHGLL